MALNQAVASHDAGVGTNLDVLRARVQLQTQQQALKISHQPRTLSLNPNHILGDNEVVVEDRHSARLRKKH